MTRTVSCVRAWPHALQWRHNECDGVSNHRRLDCLLECLFRRRSTKTSKLPATGLYGGDSPVTGEFPAQSASNTENVSIWWRHHGLPSPWGIICFFTVRTITVSHYNNVIMDTIVSQITSLTIAYSTVYSGADQRKHQSSASLAFVWGIHRGPVNSPHKWPVTRKMFPFDDVIMWRIALVLTFVCRYDDTYVVE